MKPRTAALTLSACAALALAGCSSSGGSAGTPSGGTTEQTVAGKTDVSVTASDSACDLSSTTGPAGQFTFTVKNTGGQATEFEVLTADGQRILGEVENIGPQLTRDMTLVLKPDTYTTACIPGMAGDGVRGTFTVTGSGAVVTDAQELVQAATEYRAWVANEAQALKAGTAEFVAAMRAGDMDQAKQLYPEVRAHWEAIEPVAESFGDLDPRLDARVNDVEEGDEWTGWHRLEKALWKDQSLDGTARYVDLLESDTEELVTKIIAVQLTADQVTNGAKELLDEVANGKVTGEEERYSHTDLWDFQANIDGAKKSYDVVADVVADKNPALKAQLDAAFADLQSSLDLYKTDHGFVLYTDLTDAQVKELAAKVEALSEPLAELTDTVVS